MTTHAHTPVRTIPFKLTVTKVVLFALVAIGLVAAVMRYTKGIGAISNLTNVYSFGLWISLDLLCGVALAAGAFTTCAAVYIFKLEQFRPLVRPAVLTGWLGYLMVIFALLVDLARPERIWHMMIYWNIHSPLFEVGLCVMTYTTVLTFEFAPLVLEKFGWHKPLNFLHKITLPLIVLGVWLSTLHQSSLGSLFLVMADKVNPLWHSPMLPVFFFISAAMVGLSMVIFESTIAARAYGRKPETHLLGRFAKAIPWFLGLYLTLKIGELIYAGELGLMFKPGLLTTLFWIELLGGVVTPMILFSLPAIRRSGPGLFISALLVILGLMLNRFDVGLISWQRPVWAGSYFPSFGEFAISAGVIAAGILAYDWVARNLNLFGEGHGHEEGGHHA